MSDKTTLTAREFGKEFAKGALWDFLFPFYGLIVVLAAIGTAALNEWSPRDATDSPRNRSGFELMTDYGTGCQYLKTQEGTITPRRGRDGKQVCVAA